MYGIVSYSAHHTLSDDTKYNIPSPNMTTMSGRRRWRGPRRPLPLIAAAATIVITAAFVQSKLCVTEKNTVEYWTWN